MLRLVLDARLASDPAGGAQYCVPDCTVSDAYLADLAATVGYLARYPNVQMLVSIWSTDYSWWVGSSTADGWGGAGGEGEGR